MWGVFTKRMNLTNDDIIAMTKANFSGETDPKNETSVYQGDSSYSRCAWEIKLGNVVSTTTNLLRNIIEVIATE